MQQNDSTLIIAKQAFSTIQQSFPHLTMHQNEGEPVELSFTLPKQEKLLYQIDINLQNIDELHFSSEHFWTSWFPCTDPDITQDYITAITKFIAGEYRICEHYRGKKCIKSELQKPMDVNTDDWLTIATSYHTILPYVWRKKGITYIQNTKIIQAQ